MHVLVGLFVAFNSGRKQGTLTMVFSTSPVSGVTIKSADDHDLLGVIGALELICDLESRLRQAIQHTHPLTTSLDWDFQAADRERGALLSIRCVV